MTRCTDSKLQENLTIGFELFVDNFCLCPPESAFQKNVKETCVGIEPHSDSSVFQSRRKIRFSRNNTYMQPRENYYPNRDLWYTDDDYDRFEQHYNIQIKRLSKKIGLKDDISELSGKLSRRYDNRVKDSKNK